MSDRPLTSTTEAAKAVGVARTTLGRWWREGLVTPDLITAGGHARWHVETLREQLRALAATKAADVEAELDAARAIETRPVADDEGQAAE